MDHKFVMRMNNKDRRIISRGIRRYATSGVLMQSEIIAVKKLSYNKQDIIFHPPGEIFYGPSVDGEDDVAYTRVVSGKVMRGLPSFAIK